jgi:hypothetical protein
LEQCHWNIFWSNGTGTYFGSNVTGTLTKMTQALYANMFIFTGARCSGNATPTVAHKAVFSVELCTQTYLQSSHHTNTAVLQYDSLSHIVQQFVWPPERTATSTDQEY